MIDAIIDFIQHWQAPAYSLALLFAAVIVGLLVHYIVFKIIHHFAERTSIVLDKSLIKHCRAPLRVLMPLIAIRATVPFHTMNLTERTVTYLGLIITTIVILSIAWLLIRLTYVLQDFILAKYKVDVIDNLTARKIVTQIDIIRKIFTFIIIVVSISIALMNIENFRRIGTSLLASAGLAGLIIGLAAQRTIANILAGVQIALTQPIRIDDVVIVENEWGRIEEITLTYVVVAIWDMRRLVLPISYFIEQPFQNWTRVSANILAIVFLHIDFTVPIEAIRQQLGKIVEASKYFDGKVWRLHTTGAQERTVEIRALMSARNSGDAWELQCEVREKLIEYLQKHHPDGLPRLRTELVDGELKRPDIRPLPA
jgi:small-conductance mechanosensitive channel